MNRSRWRVRRSEVRCPVVIFFPPPGSLEPTTTGGGFHRHAPEAQGWAGAGHGRHSAAGHWGSGLSPRADVEAALEMPCRSAGSSSLRLHAHRFAATEMSTLQVCSSRHPLSRGEFDFTVYLSATLFSSEHVKQHSCNAPRSRPAQRVNAMKVTRRRNFGRISTHSRTLLCSSLGRLVLLLAYGLNSP